LRVFRRRRLQLQSQPPVRIRPSKCKRTNGTKSHCDAGEQEKPGDDPATVRTSSRRGVLSEFFVEHVEPWHVRRFKFVWHPFPSDGALTSRTLRTPGLFAAERRMMRASHPHLKPLASRMRHASARAAPSC
jgi:hypothetical protein